MSITRTTEPSVQQPSVQQPSALRRFLAAYIQPIIFVLGFPLAFASALHAPSPHDLSILILGPSAVVAEATSALDATDAIAATHTEDTAAAQNSVRERLVEGAVQVEVEQSQRGAQPTFHVTTYIAGGGGLAATSVVRQTGQELAEDLGTTSEVVDVAPLADGDGIGTGLFFLLTYTSLGGYVTITGLMQFRPRARLRTQYTAAGVTATGSPLLVFGLSAIFIGDYGLSTGSFIQLMAITSLYVFTVAAMAILLQQFLGRAATAGIMAVIVFLNFPAAGGAVSASMLPTFWRGLHSFYFGSGAMESFRSIVYFDGNGMERWVLQLAAWAVGLVALTLIVQLRRTVRRQAQLLAAVRPVTGSAQHLTPDADLSPAQAATRELASAGTSTGTEAAR